MGSSKTIRRVVYGCIWGLAAATGAQAATVLSNNVAPGDAFTNAGGANQGQAVGVSGWYYNNVRNNGTVGISTALPRSGNGSAAMSGPANAKADIEYLGGGTSVGGNYFATSSLGAFTSLSSMSYDWYRSSASTAAAHFHPAIRVLLDLDGNLATTGDRGGLVFERIYNPDLGGVATDTWVSEAIGAATKLWNFGLGLGNEFDIDGDGTPYDTLAEWQASGRLANAIILGFNAGIGSGWNGTFSGAVDNISWTIGGVTTLSNFEVGAAQVPEPGSFALLGAGLLGLLALRRRVPGARA